MIITLVSTEDWLITTVISPIISQIPASLAHNMTKYDMYLIITQLTAEVSYGNLQAIVKNSECYIGASVFIIVGSYQDCSD